MRAKPSRFVLVLVVQTVWFSGCATKQQAAAGPPAVEFVEVSQRDVPVTKEWVATLDGFVNAQIRTQVKGLLVRQRYTNGAFVSKDSALFEIDPRPFRAALDQASANLEQAKANLQRAEAQLGKTQLDVTLYTPLARDSAIIVGYDGVVYQKDLGPDTLKIFNDMELYNPDKTWSPTEDSWPADALEASAAATD